MNTYCNVCENILREAEYMFQERSHDYVKGPFNWVDKSRLRKSCHLCALLLYGCGTLVFDVLRGDPKTETSYTLNSHRRDDGSNLTSDILTVTISSKSISSLSTAQVNIAFHEGLWSVYVPVSHQC
jgi:hypothetical protein